MNMEKAKEVSSETDIILSNINCQNKIIIDVGCGDGELTNILSKHSKFVYGIDVPEVIEKLHLQKSESNIEFKQGVGQNLSFENNFADIIIFFASFHHVPECEMSTTIQECSRVLKKKGHLCFLEPVAEKNSYYRLIRIIDDETEVREHAYNAIKNVNKSKFNHLIESFYFIRRTFENYQKIVEANVNAEVEKKKILNEAKKIVDDGETDFLDCLFKSYCRLNILEKIN